MSQEATIEQFLNDWNAAARKKDHSRIVPAISASISFSEEETSRMEPVFAYSFAKRGSVAHVTKEKRKSGSFLYTIKYIQDCQNITAKNTDLRKAKESFISKTWRATV